MLVDRNFDFLGGYCLLPSGYYWLLVVTWWLLLVTGGYCSLLVVTARYRSLLLVPTFTMNGQKFRSNFNGKYILFQKIGTLSQQQPNFTSSYEKHGGINSSTSSSKKIIFQTKNPTVYPSREDKGISPCLETTHKRSRALGFSSRLPWLPNSSPNGTSTGEVSKTTKVKSGTTKTRRSGCEGNAGKGSISTVFNSTFLSSLFLISKKGGGNRPVINLKMDGLHCLKYELRKRSSMYKIDLKDGYFSVPLHKDSRDLVRFHWAGILYEFLCLCFCFGTSS